MPIARRILVVEDDPAIRAGVRDALRLGGHTPLEAADGDDGLRLALEEEVDLVLLDVVLPKKDGIAVLADIRRERPTLPVIMLTARGTEADRVRGLAGGADDYVVKPFSLRELLARVEAVLRRSPERSHPVEKLRLTGGGEADLKAMAARAPGGAATTLSEREAELLRYLAAHPGRAISRDELLLRVWRIEGVSGGETRAVDACVLRLREKIGDGALRTVHGKGYLLETLP
jgi:DNA-binding response OmpR family regulator